MILGANQKARFPANHRHNLCIKTMQLLLILNKNLLYKRYLRKRIDALDEGLAMLVLRESREMSRDPETPTLTIAIIHENFIKRVFPSNKIS